MGGRTLQTHFFPCGLSQSFQPGLSPPLSQAWRGAPLSNVLSQLCKALGGRIPSRPQQAITWCPEAWSLITLISVYHCIKDCWWEYWPRALSMKRCRPVSRNKSGSFSFLVFFSLAVEIFYQLESLKISLFSSRCVLLLSLFFHKLTEMPWAGRKRSCLASSLFTPLLL